MPFSVKRYGTRAKFAKMKRCVKAVRAKDGKVNPFAVCRASVYPKHPRRYVGVMAFAWSKKLGGYKRTPQFDR